MIGPSSKNIVQCAWVVNDLKQTAMKWVEFFGIGPFYILDLDRNNIQYRGKPSELHATVALAHSGNVQVELIEQHSKGPSVYRDMFKEGESGFHHCGILTSNFDTDMEAYLAAGYPVVTYSVYNEASPRFAYFDARKDFDIFLELIENSNATQSIFDLIKLSSENWDGNDPLRILQKDGSYRVPE